MKTLVRYEFDNSSFRPRDFNDPLSVKMIDPPHIPATGDHVDIKMEDFFSHAELLKNFDEQSEGQAYFAERLKTIIRKDEIEVIIVLYQEEIFKGKFPHLFAGEFAA